MGLPAPGIFPFPDGNGIVKVFPQPAKPGLCFIRRGHTELLQGHNEAAPRRVQQRLPVGAVVKQEAFVLHPLAEMTPQQRQHLVFGLYLAHQDALHLGKADKAPQQLAFSLQMAHRL